MNKESDPRSRFLRWDPSADLAGRKTRSWNAKCPIFLGNFTSKTSNYCLKNGALGFPVFFFIFPRYPWISDMVFSSDFFWILWFFSSSFSRKIHHPSLPQYHRAGIRTVFFGGKKILLSIRNASKQMGCVPQASKISTHLGASQSHP